MFIVNKIILSFFILFCYIFLRRVKTVVLSEWKINGYLSIYQCIRSKLFENLIDIENVLTLSFRKCCQISWCHLIFYSIRWEFRKFYKLKAIRMHIARKEMEIRRRNTKKVKVKNKMNNTSSQHYWRLTVQIWSICQNK